MNRIITGEIKATHPDGHEEQLAWVQFDEGKLKLCTHIGNKVIEFIMARIFTSAPMGMTEDLTGGKTYPERN